MTDHESTHDSSCTKFDTYQDIALTTAVYPDAKTGNNSELMYLALGLGEAGEVQNLVKKVYRDDPSYEEVTQTAKDIIKELGDILWYIAVMAHVLGTDLSEVAGINQRKLLSRQQRGVLSGSGDER